MYVMDLSSPFRERTFFLGGLKSFTYELYFLIKKANYCLESYHSLKTYKILTKMNGWNKESILIYKKFED